MTNTNPELILVGHGSVVTDLAFSADGKTLVSAGCDDRAIVWDVETGGMRRVLKLRDHCGHIALSPDGTIAVTDDGRVWDAGAGKLLRTSSRYMAPLAISPDGRTLACSTYVLGSDLFHILLADVRSGRTVHRFPCREYQPNSVAFSADGKLVAASGADYNEDDHVIPVTTVFNRRTREIRQVLEGEAVALFGIYLERGVRLVAVSLDGTALWNAETGEFLKGISPARTSGDAFDGELTVAVSDDGQLLALGTSYGAVQVLSLATGEPILQMKALEGWLRALAFTPDSSLLATAGDDKTIRLWDAETGTCLRTLGGRGTSPVAVAFTADGASVNSIDEHGLARCWSLRSLRVTRQETNTMCALRAYDARNADLARNWWTGPTSLYRNQYGMVPAIGAISRDGSLALVGMFVSYIWNVGTQTRQGAPVDLGGNNSFVFSPDNRFLATITDTDGTKIRLHDTRTGGIVREFAAAGYSGGCDIVLAFSRDEERLAAGHADFAIDLWNTKTGKSRRLSARLGDGVCTLAFSPDGQTLAIGTAYAESVELRSLARGKKSVWLRGHADDNLSAEFSPDGALVATSARDGTVRLWESATGKLLATFQSLPDKEWVAFSPDGYFERSPGAEKFIVWKTGEDLLPADAVPAAHGNPRKPDLLGDDPK